MRVVVVVAAFCGFVVGCGGSDISKVEKYFCSGRLVNTTTGDPVFLHHYVYEYPDGSMFTTCDAVISSWQVSGTLIYRPQDVGAATATCLITADIGGRATGGFFRFDISADRKTSTALYMDSDVSASPVVMPCTYHSPDGD